MVAGDSSCRKMSCILSLSQLTALGSEGAKGSTVLMASLALCQWSVASWPRRSWPEDVRTVVGRPLVTSSPSDRLSKLVGLIQLQLALL